MFVHSLHRHTLPLWYYVRHRVDITQTRYILMDIKKIAIASIGILGMPSLSAPALAAKPVSGSMHAKTHISASKPVKKTTPIKKPTPKPKTKTKTH